MAPVCPPSHGSQAVEVEKMQPKHHQLAIVLDPSFIIQLSFFQKLIPFDLVTAEVRFRL